jgi:hypothetical protein
MSSDMKTVLDKIANPLKFYRHPQEVEMDEELSRADKIKLLMNWLDDIKLRQIAEGENMPSPRELHYYTADVENLLNYYRGLEHSLGRP